MQLKLGSVLCSDQAIGKLRLQCSSRRKFDNAHQILGYSGSVELLRQIFLENLERIVHFLPLSDVPVDPPAKLRKRLVLDWLCTNGPWLMVIVDVCIPVWIPCITKYRLTNNIKGAPTPPPSVLVIWQWVCHPYILEEKEGYEHKTV